MSDPQPLTTYLELRESTAEGEVGAGLSHKAEGLVLLHVMEIAAHGEPRGGAALLHDAGDHGGRYVSAARVLARDRWAVALPDLRGHGRSEGPRGHSAGVREVVRDIDEVQMHLAYRLPIAPRALLGQGLGALYALAYALERPGQLGALVLLSPRWSPHFEPAASGGLLSRFRKPAPTAPCRIDLAPAALCSDPEEQKAWSADPLVHDVITLRAAAQAAEIARDQAQRIASVDCPVLILHGTADPLADPEQSRAKAGGRVDVRLIEGGLHDLLHDRCAGDVLAILRGWLSEKVA